MAKKFKEKKILIEISIKDLKYLEGCFKELKTIVEEGNEEFEKKDVFYSFKVNMEYPNRTNYIEKKIDGKYYLIFKPNKK